MNTVTAPLLYDSTDLKSGVLNSVPIWGSYLYQNFLVPAFSPSEWLNTSNTPSSTKFDPSLLPPLSALLSDSDTEDYFGRAASSSPDWASLAASIKTEPLERVDDRSSFEYPQTGLGDPVLAQTSTQSQSPCRSQSQSSRPNFPSSGSGASSLSSQGYSYSPTLPTSLLIPRCQSQNRTQTQCATAFHEPSPSDENTDAAITTPSPSPPLSSVSPPHGIKRPRSSSMESDLEDEHEVPEGVERDGVIWGMRVDDYRSLSARDRKRVRNRISARTFRAKRKEHLTSLESTLAAKDLQIKLANEEAAKLMREMFDLKRRLQRYETVGIML
ncbi:MAG: hypothetical protein TREMPRED_001552 [Tremellales sp. Tagirdzhanova-0007]|nr:MAG: hypothetical protein TREMPRED_001552 [Tremellales sp. Tagirdzhanova-0007]